MADVKYVPEHWPYGSITDGSVVCGRCGMDITGCMLCAGEVVHLVSSPPPKPQQWGNWGKRNG